MLGIKGDDYIGLRRYLVFLKVVQNAPRTPLPPYLKLKVMPRYKSLAKIMYVNYKKTTIVLYVDTGFVPKLTQNAPGTSSKSYL